MAACVIYLLNIKEANVLVKEGTRGRVGGEEVREAMRTRSCRALCIMAKVWILLWMEWASTAGLPGNTVAVVMRLDPG